MDQQLQKKWVDGIPVQWVLPRESPGERRLIVFLPSFGGSNQQVADLLIDIAGRGSIGLSIDPWQHGDRGSESRDAIFARVFSAFRKNIWPILGQTSIDILRVIDWAIAGFHIQSPVRVGGLSMRAMLQSPPQASTHALNGYSRLWLHPIGCGLACVI